MGGGAKGNDHHAVVGRFSQPDRHRQRLVGHRRELSPAWPPPAATGRRRFRSRTPAAPCASAGRTARRDGMRWMPAAGQGLLQFLEAGVLVGAHGLRAVRRWLPSCCTGVSPGDVDGLAATVDQQFERSDADHEELVQVQAGQGQRPQPFEQRDAIVARFVQESLVVLEPAQFAVQVTRGFRFHAGVRFVSSGETRMRRGPVCQREIRNSTRRPKTSSKSEPFCWSASCSSERSSV